MKETEELEDYPETRDTDGTGRPGIGMGRTIIIILLILLLLLPSLGYPLIWSLYAAPVLLLIAAIFYYLSRKSSSGRPADIEDQQYRTLLDKARGDRSLAERLIDYERRRNPHATRTQHIHDAIERWERDR